MKEENGVFKIYEPEEKLRTFLIQQVEALAPLLLPISSSVGIQVEKRESKKTTDERHIVKFFLDFGNHKLEGRGEDLDAFKAGVKAKEDFSKKIKDIYQTELQKKALKEYINYKSSGQLLH